MDLNSITEKLKERLNNTEEKDRVYTEMGARRINGDAISFPKMNNPRLGAVLILLYLREDEVYFPLIQRPEYEGVHGGQMALPGGKRENEDPDLIATALRETEEEIGVPRREVEVIGHMSSFYVGASNYEVLPVLGLTRDIPNFIPDEEEVAEVVEVRLSDLLDEGHRKEKILVVRGFELMAPYFDLSNKVVWGATAMILAKLKHYLTYE